LFAAVAVGGGGLQLASILAKVRLDERASCNRAFIHCVRFGWIVLAAIILDKLFAQPTPTPATNKQDKDNKLKAAASKELAVVVRQS
jgi:hypothetical protein